MREKFEIFTVMSILIVEQKVKGVLEIADRAYLLRLGKIALEDDAKTMLEKGKYIKYS